MRSILLAAALAASIAAPAVAQVSCGPRDDVAARLTDRFGETLAGGGLKSETQVIEVWASHESGTWTIMITNANGVACVVAAGTNWHQNAAADVPEGDPS